MADLKGVWKQTAKSFVLAFNDLGISLSKSAKVGIDKAVEWARKDNPHYEAEGVEIPDVEAPAAEEAEPQAEAPAEEPAEAPAEEAAQATAE